MGKMSEKLRQKRQANKHRSALAENSKDFLHFKALIDKMDYQAAIDSLQNHLKTAPKESWAWHMLGTVFFILEEFKAAEEPLKRAYALSPENETIFRDYAATQIRLAKQNKDILQKLLGRHNFSISASTGFYLKGMVALYVYADEQAAQLLFSQAFAGQALALYAHELSQSFLRQRQYEESITWARKALECDEGNLRYWDGLAVVYAWSGKSEHAILIYKKLTEENPKNETFVARLAYVLGQKSVNVSAREYKDAIAFCLKKDNLNHQELFRNWLYIIDSFDSFSGLQNLIFNKSGAWGARWLEENRSVLNDDFIIDGLKNFRPADIVLENFLIDIRKRFLDAVLDQNEVLPEYSSFISALARQCFLNEYVFEISEDEQNKIEDLKKWIEKNTNHQNFQAASLLYFSYYPVLSEDWTEETMQIFQSVEDSLFKEIWEFIYEHTQKEKELVKTIPSFSEELDETSQQVKAMYEENPYPRWITTTSTQTQQSPDYKDVKSILIAGCGTGQQIVYVKNKYPDAKITAIDLSYRSLSYAKRKVMELGYDNISFYQGDILDIQNLEQKFDRIECSGVLHHMNDPMKGWQSLLSVLHAGGSMNIGLYSKTARRYITQAQNAVKEMNLGGNLDDIRQFRQYIKSLPKDHALHNIGIFGDFFTTSSCRDLLFHVCEHQYTIAELKSCLKQLDLTFAGFHIRQMDTYKKYESLFPEDLQKTNLDYWEEYEGRYPNTFIAMYQFEVVKKS